MAERFSRRRFLACSALAPLSALAADINPRGFVRMNDPHPSSVKLHIDAGSLYDVASGRDVYVKSGVSSSTLVTRPGYTNSILFAAPAADCVNCLVIPYSADFNYGSGDFTWEASCYFTTVGTQSRYVISQTNTLTSGSENVLDLYRDTTSGKAVFRVYIAGAAVLTLTGSTVLATSTWYDLKVTKTGSAYGLYVNNALEAAGTYTTALPADLATAVVIGSPGGAYNVGSSHNYNFVGNMCGVRITTLARGRSLTFERPSKRHLPVVTDPSFASVTHLYHADSINNGTVTFNAAPANSRGSVLMTRTSPAVISSTQQKFGATSFFFDGTSGGRFGTTDNNNGPPNFGSNDWTIECWVNPDASSFTGEICAHRPSVGTTFWILRCNTGKTVRFLHSNAGSTITDITTTNTLTAGSWVHVAVCRVSGSVSIYIGGTKANTVTTNASTAYTFPSAAFCIGNQDGGSGEFKGYIDELRITNGVARYTGNFTPPAASFVHR